MGRRYVFLFPFSCFATCQAERMPTLPCRSSPRVPVTSGKTQQTTSHDAYKCTCDVAITELPPTLPIRLGLALPFSVLYYEILNSPDRPCHCAKQAFDDAIAELDTLSEGSSLCMSLSPSLLALASSFQARYLTKDSLTKSYVFSQAPNINLHTGMPIVLAALCQ